MEIGLGKQFMPNLYVGLGTGAWIGTKGSDPMIPITADAKLMFPIKSTPIKPILTFRLGYLLNTAGDVEGGSQEYEGYEYETEGYEMPDFVMMEIMPGIQLPISKTTDFILSAGYTHGFATKGGGGGGFFTVKAGLNFHKDPNKKKLGPKREKVPTRNKGLQFTLEGGGNLDNGADFGYGFNHINIRVDDVEGTVRQLEKDGYEVGMYMESSGAPIYYMNSMNKIGHCIELHAPNPTIAMCKKAVELWDGKDPFMDMAEVIAAMRAGA